MSSHSWHEPQPGIFVGTLEDGRTVIERRAVTESFRQGDLLSTEFLDAGAALPDLETYTGPAPSVAVLPKSIEEPPRARKRTPKSKARKG